LFATVLGQAYLKEHPETVVVDPLDKVEVLIDRNQQYRVILDSELAIESNLIRKLICVLS
jgi:hypothetical protein